MSPSGQSTSVVHCGVVVVLLVPPSVREPLMHFPPSQMRVDELHCASVVHWAGAVGDVGSLRVSTGAVVGVVGVVSVSLDVVVFFLLVGAGVGAFVLGNGMKAFPDDWRLPYLAGQIYTQDLETKDPAQRRAWDEKGTLLIESAIRKPGAPAEAAEWAAVMRTKLGEHERAVRELREMVLVTEDGKARDALIKRLATLENANADELAAEILETRKRFEAAWHRERPSLPASMYILLGPRIPPTFDMTDLATAGHDLIGSEPVEKLEPVE